MAYTLDVSFVVRLSTAGVTEYPGRFLPSMREVCRARGHSKKYTCICRLALKD